MLGMKMPDLDVWSERVTVALGQNPSAFTGPGTNAYLVGTGRARILIDPGRRASPAFLPVLARAMERCGCERIQEIVLTHGHPDHIGGVRSVMQRFGRVRVRKLPSALFDGPYA
ncbi:MAG: MBL fold metallo-hydrolase, partial [Tabrizicola sp.]|nr:MBL fold metallo-hydrolase [Tabrizicola sp.]